MNITELVEKHLEFATVEQLQSIVENGVEIDDDDMREALENAYIERASEMLKSLGIEPKKQ